MEIAIGKIRVAGRIRKGISRIPELAEDMKINGLLNPVTVMQLDGGDFRLLAGLRRVKAAQLLGWPEIAANVVSPVDAEAMLRIEIGENEQREPFTFSEKMHYRGLLEEIESAKAKGRMSLGGKGGLAQGTDLGPCLEKKERRDAIGGQLGMSGRQYDRAKYVAGNAPPEVIGQLDRRETTIRQAYDKLRAEERAASPPAPAAPAAAAEPGPGPQPAAPRPQTGAPGQKHPARASAAPKDPFLEKLEAQQAEAVRKRLEFDALPPEGKISELLRQLKEARARAASAEASLSREKELRKNAESHLGSTIESLRNRLAAAEARVFELEGPAAKGAQP